MKKFLLLIALLAGGLMTIHAQTDEYLVSFEAESDTANWVVFANGQTPAEDDVTVVPNPEQEEPNTSEMVLRFVVNDDADPWAGMVNNVDFTGENAIAITEDNYMFSVMVYRTEPGIVGLKLEQETGGGDNVEILVPTTLVNEWEVLTFDFSASIGNTYEALVIFPDFPETREVGTIVYLDNIMLGGVTSVDVTEEMSLQVYPNPAQNQLFVEHHDMTGFTISNMLGQQVETSDFGITNRKVIDVANLNKGIYFLSVKSKDGMNTTRFIKN